MSPYQSEELENIRRTAERGLKVAQDKLDSPVIICTSRELDPFLDTFQHILDIIERIKLDAEKES